MVKNKKRAKPTLSQVARLKLFSAHVVHPTVPNGVYSVRFRSKRGVEFRPECTFVSAEEALRFGHYTLREGVRAATALMNAPKAPTPPAPTPPAPSPTPRAVAPLPERDVPMHEELVLLYGPYRAWRARAQCLGHTAASAPRAFQRARAERQLIEAQAELAFHREANLLGALLFLVAPAGVPIHG